MPPPVEDSAAKLDEESGAESESGGIPYKDPNAEAEEDEDDGEDADEYIVEEIRGHRWQDGIIEYHVKWQGYEDKDDMTWEPEENLETASEVLQEYHDSIGGRPTEDDKKGNKKPGRKSKKAASESQTPEPSSKRGRKRGAAALNGDADSDIVDIPRKNKRAKYPPSGSNWDKDLEVCETIELGDKDDSGKQVRLALVRWVDGSVQKLPLAIMHQKAPQTMLRFYEQHLSFDTA